MFRAKRKLQTFLLENEGLFSKATVNLIVRGLLEPVANQNPVSIMFSRLKDKDGFESLIKRLEYCENVEIINVLNNQILIQDDYKELEFIIFSSPRYNFAIIWDYSSSLDKKYTNLFLITNSRNVNDVFDALQSNLKTNYYEKFTSFRPERRENGLMNSAIFSIIKKLNDSIEDVACFALNENDYFVDSDKNEKLKEVSHEIKNELSIIDIHLAIMEKKNGENQNINVIKKSINSIKNSISVLKNDVESEIKEIVLPDIINDSIKSYKDMLLKNNNKIVFENSVGYLAFVYANENKLQSVINNLIKNANEATKNDTVIVNLSKQNNNILIDITNHGAKIEKENLDKIFKKDFTTKKDGSGIGLFVSKKYIESFGGELSLLESDKEKTTFRIKLKI